MKRKVLQAVFAAGAVLLTAGWLDSGFSKRTTVDVDHFRHPADKPVLLTIDAARLGKAAKSDFQLR